MAQSLAWRLVSAVVVWCGVSAALAAEGEKKRPDPEQIFKKKDTNGDAALSLEEYKAGMPEKALTRADERFKKLDSSGDGKLSLDEFKAGMKPKG
jgi:Ca2+-binding EF-hand superfamily protein